MNGEGESIRQSELRIRGDEEPSQQGHLEPFATKVERPEAAPLNPVFQPFAEMKTDDTQGYISEKPSKKETAAAERERKTKQDSISTGTFGNLVRKVSGEEPKDDEPSAAHQTVRFNLLKVGPRKNKSDSDTCEAWNKHQF